MRRKKRGQNMDTIRNSRKTLTRRSPSEVHTDFHDKSTRCHNLEEHNVPSSYF
jgi:hypothetical protein